MDGCQTDVLVDPPVAGHEALAEQLVVVGVGIVVIDTGVRRRSVPSSAPVWLSKGLAEWAMSARNAWPVRDRVRQVDRAGGLPSTSSVPSSSVPMMPSSPESRHHDLREAAVAPDEVAVGVGRQQRHVADVGIREVDAEDVARLGLQTAQVDMPPSETSSPLPKMPSARASSGRRTEGPGVQRNRQRHDPLQDQAHPRRRRVHAGRRAGNQILRDSTPCSATSSTARRADVRLELCPCRAAWRTPRSPSTRSPSGARRHVRAIPDLSGGTAHTLRKDGSSKTDTGERSSGSSLATGPSEDGSDDVSEGRLSEEPWSRKKQ